MRRGLNLGLLGLLGLVLLAPGPAALESLQPPDLDRYLRWGPLRVRPGLRISNLGFDDNIFYSRTRPVSDYRATIAPRVDGLLLLGTRAFVTFDETLRYAVYLENEDQNFLENLTRARVTVPFRRLGVFAQTRLDRRQERPIDQLDERLQRDERGFRVGVIAEPGWRTIVELSAGVLRLRHDDPDAIDPLGVAARLDRDERGLRLEASYRLFGRTRATLLAQRERLDFRSTEDTRSWSIQPGFDFGRRGTLRGSVRFGWSSIAGGASINRSRLSEPVGRAEVTWGAGRGLTLELDAERRPGFTVRNATYYVSGSYGVRAVHYVNRAIGVEIGAGLGRLSFPGDPALSGRRDRIASYDVGIRLRMLENSIGRRLEYGLRIGRWRRESTDQVDTQRRSTVVLDASIGF